MAKTLRGQQLKALVTFRIQLFINARTRHHWGKSHKIYQCDYL
jgi:hypothetical protein